MALVGLGSMTAFSLYSIVLKTNRYYGNHASLMRKRLACSLIATQGIPAKGFGSQEESKTIENCATRHRRLDGIQRLTAESLRPTRL